MGMTASALRTGTSAATPAARTTRCPQWLLLAFVLWLLPFSPVAAQRTTVAYQVGIGTSGVLDTYLSQEKFTGTGLTFLSAVEREVPEKRWSTLMEHQVNFADVDDRSGLRSELQGDYTFFLGRLRCWQLQHDWSLQAGGMAATNVGFIYNTANSNNPAQGRLSVQLMPTAVVSKHATLFHRSLRLRYEVNLPLAGVMFSPNYGQSYYEIFSLGNYDHNVVPTTFVSAPSFRQQLSVGYAVTPRTLLSVSYLGDYQQARVNHLKSHIYSHRLMVGLVRQFSIVSHRL